MTDRPTGTVTFLFTDIEGSTQIAQQHRDQWETLRARHHGLLHDAIGLHHGHVFQIIGDAFCVAFHTAGDALNAALAAQHGLQHEAWSPASIKVRMGIHTGVAQTDTVDVVTGGYTGYATLARTQRVMSVASGEQILLSNASAELVRGDLPTSVTLRDMGEHRLKGLLNPDRLWQPLAPELRTEFPPLRLLNVIPNNLPLQLTSFIGRETEITAIERWLTDPTSRLLTLVGAGGMGKTQLALEVARQNLDKFPAGVWLTELAPIDRDENVAPAVAGAIGVQAQPPRSITDTIIDALQTRVLLLVIDNCEHVLAGAAQLVAKILARCPDTKILTTSREPLHIAGERLYSVPGLMLPEKAIMVEQLAEADAIRLFVERAAAMRASFALDASNADDVVHICRALDGMPLAIELAAARVRMMSPREIVARLDKRFYLLTSRQHTGLLHHQTLQSTIAWSYDLLAMPERTVFNRLSVFHGGCTLEAAEQVFTRLQADDGIEPDDVLDLLTSLVDKSMLVADTSSDGATRYWLLETLREFGHERLIECGQEATVCKRHAEYYTMVAEQLDAWLWSGQPLGAHELWVAEEDNLFAAQAWLASQKDGRLALRLSGAMNWCYTIWCHHRLQEYMNNLLRAFEKAREIPAIDHVKALLALGTCYQDAGDLAQALTYYEESLALARLSDRRLLIGQALFQLVQIDMELGRPGQLHLHAAECAEIGRDTNAILLAASANLGIFEPPARRAALIEEFLATALREGAFNTGYAFQMLAVLARNAGNFPRASELYEESYCQYIKFAQNGGPAAVMEGQGRIALLQGEYARASALFEQSRTLWRNVGWEGYAAFPNRLLGVAAWYQGDYKMAARRYQESYAIIQRFQNQDELAVTTIYQALLLRDQGRYQDANTLCAEGLQGLRQINFKEEVGWALAAQASILERLGEVLQSVTTYRECLPCFNESSDLVTRVAILEGLGIALASAKDYRRAAHLLAFAEVQRNQMGIIIPPPEQPCHDAAINRLREALDAETLSQAWQIGQALTLDKAVAEALEEVDA